MFSVNKDPSNEDLRKFGWAMLFGFGMLGAILWVFPFILPWGVWDTATLSWSGEAKQIAAFVFWGLGVFLCILGVGIPVVAKPVYVIWMSIAVPIGLVMSTLMLSVLFFLLLPVFSIIVRSGDPLRKKLNSGESYWEDYRHYEPTLERMRRPF